MLGIWVLEGTPSQTRNNGRVRRALVPARRTRTGAEQARRNIDETQWGPAPVLESAKELARAGPSGTIVTNRLGTTSKGSYPDP